MKTALTLPIFKRCTTCGKRYSREAWAALPSIGSKPDTDDNGKPISLEFRNCSCGSTLTVEVPAKPEPAGLIFLRDGEVFEIRRRHGSIRSLEVTARASENMEEAVCNAADLTRGLAGLAASEPAALEHAAAELRLTPVEIARGAAWERGQKKEPQHAVVEIDPRDACLDEIAELLRGEVGADEIGEISRIVESSGRKLSDPKGPRSLALEATGKRLRGFNSRK